jgi:uncharacterized protein YndB with AHSA1/START domain
MKTMRNIILGTILFVILACIFPFMIPATSKISRSVTVYASTDSVYRYLTKLENFSEWNPWDSKRSPIQTTTEGSGIGSTFSWEGRTVGQGSMTLTNAKPNKEIITKVIYTKPLTSSASNRWVLQPAEDGATEVTWEFEENISYFSRYLSLLTENLLGDDLEKGLGSLKKKLEKK